MDHGCVLVTYTLYDNTNQKSSLSKRFVTLTRPPIFGNVPRCITMQPGQYRDPVHDYGRWDSLLGLG